MAKILIVEDDPQIAKVLQLNLKLEGHEVEHAERMDDGLGKAMQQTYDALLLDIGLPDGTGLDLCQKLRESGSDVPILFLSARTDEATVVKGINLGADDYIRKPFGTEELKARLNKLLRKAPPGLKSLSFKGLAVDLGRRLCVFEGRPISVGRKELEILTLLIKSGGDVVTRERILSGLEGGDELYDRTIDSHMSHLRKKIREVAGERLKIHSVYGVGYRLEEGP